MTAPFEGAAPEAMSLEQAFASLPRVAIALSGGVDSMTLAAFARAQTAGVFAFHAVSAAVPREATERVRALCAQRAIALQIIDAGEMSDPRYLDNPADRCFFCKSNLYDAIARHTDLPVVSGTNLDDMGDYRPGLKAAAARGVRHPFVEARMDKGAVRALARALALGDLAELPAQPCLSSRVETGIRIDARVLDAIDDVERRARALLGERATIRCRVRAHGVVLELDGDAFAALSAERRAGLTLAVGPSLRDAGLASDLVVERYRMGSAFLRVL